MKTVLFVDWENFKKKLKSVLEKEGIKDKQEWHNYNFWGLFNQVLQGIEIDQRIFYAARLKIHPLTEEKSRELIEEQRLLKTYLEKAGFEFIYSGRVRGDVKVDGRGKEFVVFKEKGVDVQIAVDLMRMACDGELKTAIIASSDSDIIPAVKELKRRGIECIYLGFELEPNKGLAYTAGRTILFRDSEVLRFLPPKLFR